MLFNISLVIQGFWISLEDNVLILIGQQVSYISYHIEYHRIDIATLMSWEFNTLSKLVFAILLYIKLNVNSLCTLYLKVTGSWCSPPPTSAFFATQNIGKWSLKSDTIFPEITLPGLDTNILSIRVSL